MKDNKNINMSDFETMSNKELRAKCIEYGLPNVPVTNSSRKLLIRRLVAAVSHKPSTAGQTKPRQTTKASKQSEITSPPKITIENNNNDATKETTTSNRTSHGSATATKRHFVTIEDDLEGSVASAKRVEVTKTKTEGKSLYPKLPVKEPSTKPQSRTGISTFLQENNKNPKTCAESDDVDTVMEELHPYNPSTETVKSGTQYRSFSTSSSSFNYSKPFTYTTMSSNIRKNFALPNKHHHDRGSTAAIQVYEVEDGSDDEVVISDSPLGRQTKFLSQFARNLENIKASTRSLRNLESVHSRSCGEAVIAPRRSLKDLHETW